MSTPGVFIDLNADVGEGYGAWSIGDDAALLDIVTSASIACGFHAGDPRIMRQTCEAAAYRGVVIGAHVSYRDLEGFGRRDVEIETDRLTDELLYQIGALDSIAHASGSAVRYVKAHGALYNRCAHDEAHATAVVQAVVDHRADLTLVAAPGSVLADLAVAAGVRCVLEGFVDRAYRPDRTLVPRTERHAVHAEAEQCIAQALALATRREVRTDAGTVVGLDAATLCMHSDTPHAVATALLVRDALRDAGIVVQAFA